MKDFTDLDVYKIASKLTSNIYSISALFPDEEKYGIVSQLRRAVLSIGANIAEACGRYHYLDRVRFLYNARGSLLEVKHFILEAEKLGFIDKKTKKELMKNIRDLSVKLNNYIDSTKKLADTRS